MIRNRNRLLSIVMSLAVLNSACLTLPACASERLPVGADLPQLHKNLAAARSSGDKAEQALLLYTIGELEMGKGRVAAAEKAIRESLEIDLALGTKSIQLQKEQYFPAVHTRIALAEVLTQQRKFDEALQLYEAGYQAAQKFELDEEVVKIESLMGSIYLSLNQEDKAIAYFKKGLEAAKNASFDESAIHLETQLAEIARRKRSFDEGFEYLKQASATVDAMKGGGGSSDDGGKSGKAKGKGKNNVNSIDGVALEFDDSSNPLFGRVMLEYGRMYSDMGLKDEALEKYNKAIELYGDDAESYQLADAIVSRAEIRIENRDPEKARVDLEKAMEVLANAEDQGKLQATCLILLGGTKADLGDFTGALADHKKAEKLAATRHYDALECLAVSEQGLDHLMQGNSEAALKEFLRTLKMAEKRPNLTNAEWADSLRFCAMGFRNVGAIDAAIQNYANAAKLYGKAGKPLEQALALDSIAVAYLDKGDFAQFEKFHKDATSVFDKASTTVKAGGKSSRPDARTEATMAYNYAQFCVMKDMFTTALESYEKALAAYKSIGDMAGHCTVLRGMGLTYLLLGQHQKSRDCYQAASVIADKISNLESQWDCAVGLGKANLKLGDSETAEKMLLRAVSLAEKERGQLSRDSFKTAALDLREDCIFELVELLIKQNRFGPALEMAEKGRARAFLDMLECRKQSSYGQRLISAVPDVLDQASQAIKQPPKEEPVKIAMATVPQGGWRSVSVTPKTTNVMVEASVLSPVNAKAPTIDEIKSLVKSCNTYVVEYLTAPDKIMVWVMKPDGEIANAQVIPVKTKVLRDAILNAYNNINATPKGIDEVHALDKKRQDSLKVLHKILIEPVEKFLPTDENQVVTVVPHGSLFSVPFAALVSPQNKFWVEQHTIAYLPAIAVLRATKKIETETKNEQNSFLAFGNPITELNKFLGKLPYAEKEVKKISSLFGAGKSSIEVGDAATKTKFKELAPKYSYIHLATHGLINQEQPMNSAVVLAPEAGDDGLLTVKDIMMNLPPLKAKMVVLSACQTGQGKIQGDGVTGLSRAFVIAGTPSVLVSLWSVDDVMTEYQMESLYYELLKGSNKAAALRKAQLKTITFMEKGLPSSRDDDDKAKVAAAVRANPRYWGAFQLIGEYD